MPSLKKLIQDVKDPNEYDGAVFIAMKDGKIANFGFTGDIQQGIDQRVFLYRILSEASFVLAFHPSAQQPSETEG